MCCASAAAQQANRIRTKTDCARLRIMDNSSVCIVADEGAGMRLLRYGFMILCLLSAWLILAQSDEGIMIPAHTTALIDFAQGAPTTYRIRQNPDQPTVVTISGVEIPFTAAILDENGTTLAEFAEGVFIVMLELGSGDAIFTLHVEPHTRLGVVLVRIGSDYDEAAPTLADARVLPPATATPTPTFTPTHTPTFTPTFTPTETFTPTLTPSHTPTNTPSNTPTETHTPSLTPSNTRRPTETPAPTETNTRRPTRTIQPTATLAPTETNTRPPRNTATLSPTETNTRRPTQTIQSTATLAPTETNTRPPRSTATLLPTETNTRRPTLTPSNTPRPPTSTPIVSAPEDTNYQLDVTTDAASTVSDVISFPAGDREDRVFYDVLNINPDAKSPDGRVTLIITATCTGTGVENVNFSTVEQTFACGDTIIIRQVVFDSKSGSVLVSATGGENTYVTWTLTGTAERVNP